MQEPPLAQKWSSGERRLPLPPRQLRLRWAPGAARLLPAEARTPQQRALQGGLQTRPRFWAAGRQGLLLLAKPQPPLRPWLCLALLPGRPLLLLASVPGAPAGAVPAASL